MKTFLQSAVEIIPETLEEFCEHSPEDISTRALHELRISTKKLRYTLELFGSCSPDNFAPFIAQLKKLQELLGEIHDCDVTIQLLNEKLPMIIDTDPNLLNSLASLLSKLAYRRTKLINELNNLQSSLRDFPTRLRNAIKAMY